MPSTSPLPIFEQADHWFRRARAALLEALPCRNGCSRCCIGPFPITMLDVEELQRGLAALPPERHATIWNAPSGKRPQSRRPTLN